jgi:uncharacterized membrane protein YoaK (UPF0700 family)
MPEEQVGVLSKWKRVLLNSRYFAVALLLILLALQAWKGTSEWLDWTIWWLLWLVFLVYALFILSMRKGQDRIR